MNVPATPLSPSQAKALQHESVPGFVFDECNKLITAGLRHGQATVTYNDLLTAVRARVAGLPEYAHMDSDVPQHWVSPENIRRAYEPVGWNVEFDRPAYYESGESKFLFTERR